MNLEYRSRFNILYEIYPGNDRDDLITLLGSSTGLWRNDYVTFNSFSDFCPFEYKVLDDISFILINNDHVSVYKRGEFMWGVFTSEPINTLVARGTLL